MPLQRSRYPKDWPAISRRIREEAGHRCQWCGKPNGLCLVSIKGHWFDDALGIWRSGATPKDQVDPRGNGGGYLFRFNPPVEKCRVTRVVCTVAHTSLSIEGDKHNKHDLSGLRCLCQRCHLLHDLDDHRAVQKKNREKRKRALQPVLLEL